MRCASIARSLVASLAVTFCANAACAKDEMPVATAFSVEPLVAACSAPEAEYRLLTQADLKAARARLVAAVQRLDQKLTATDATEADKRQSAQWKLYLKWDRLQAELGKDRPDPAELARLYKAFRGEHSQEDQRKDP